MSFLAFFEQLGETPWSVALHESEIAYSLIESLHVWSMCLFFGMTIIFDLRLLGLIMRSVPVSEVIRRLQPWTILGFVMMAITGTLLFYAIPLRSFQNIFFRTKMLLMANRWDDGLAPIASSLRSRTHFSGHAMPILPPQTPKHCQQQHSWAR